MPLQDATQDRGPRRRLCYAQGEAAAEYRNEQGIDTRQNGGKLKVRRIGIGRRASSPEALYIDGGVSGHIGDDVFCLGHERAG